MTSSVSINSLSLRFANIPVPQPIPQNSHGCWVSYDRKPSSTESFLTKEKQQEVNMSLFIKTGNTLHYKAAGDRR
jgi:hypothetical protein